MKVSSSKNNFQFSDNEYGYLTLSANQTSGFSVGDPIKFNTKSAGNITFNPATYQVTLKKNRTYRLMSGVTTATTNAGYLEPRFYNVTAGASLGTIGEGVTTTYTSNLAPQCMAYAVITPTVDTVIEVRIYAVSGTPTAIYSRFSFWEIQQINIVSPVIQDPSRNYAYVSPQVNLTVTSSAGGAGFTVIRATGYFYKLNNGTWKLNANICTSQNATTTRNISISGVVFQTTTNNYQGCAAGTNVTSSFATGAYTNPNTNEITYKSEGNYAYVMLSLDVELAGKPTGYGLPTDI